MNNHNNRSDRLFVSTLRSNQKTSDPSGVWGGHTKSGVFGLRRQERPHTVAFGSDVYHSNHDTRVSFRKQRKAIGQSNCHLYRAKTPNVCHLSHTTTFSKVDRPVKRISLPRPGQKKTALEKLMSPTKCRSIQVNISKSKKQILARPKTTGSIRPRRDTLVDAGPHIANPAIWAEPTKLQTSLKNPEVGSFVNVGKKGNGVIRRVHSDGSLDVVFHHNYDGLSRQSSRVSGSDVKEVFRPARCGPRDNCYLTGTTDHIRMENPHTKLSPFPRFSTTKGSEMFPAIEPADKSVSIIDLEKRGKRNSAVFARKKDSVKRALSHAVECEQNDAKRANCNLNERIAVRQRYYSMIDNFLQVDAARKYVVKTHANNPMFKKTAVY